MLRENKEAQVKVIYPTDNKQNIKLDFKAYGKNIFQNLILTINAYSTNEQDGSTPVPIKTIWKRVRNETQIYIQDTNSNSYIPTAEDIGYIIEVEATPLEDNQSPIIAQYGPIFLSSEVKNSLEMILGQGEAKFSCYLYSVEDQNKIKDRQFEIILNYQELKLLELKQDTTIEIENVKINSNNPLIKLHNLDSTRFSLKFFNSDFNDNINYEYNSISNKKDSLSTKIKSEYNLIAMSKNQRELFYLLFQCFLVDEKIKNKKLFSYLNFKILPEEMKNGVIDLISEIKNLKEENNILLHNSKFYEVENNQLKRELKELEDDFHITMEQLNCPNIQIEVQNDIENRKNLINNNSNNSTNTPYNNSNDSNINYFELKKQYDEIKANYSSLISKEKALREENKNFNFEIDLLKSKNNGYIKEVNELKETLESRLEEIASLNKSNNFLTELNNKVSKEINEINNKLTEITKENEILNKLNSENTSNNDSELIKLKQTNKELLNKIENIEYELQTFKVQNNMFKTQKEQITKELAISMKDKEDLKKVHNENKLIIKNQADNITNMNEEIEQKNKEYNIINTKYSELEQKYSLLLIEKENYANTQNNNLHCYDGNQNIKSINASVLDESVYRIGRDEYEDFDNFKKEKDEMECQLLFLKSNFDAQKLEIDALKDEIKKLKG